MIIATIFIALTSYHIPERPSHVASLEKATTVFVPTFDLISQRHVRNVLTKHNINFYEHRGTFQQFSSFDNDLEILRCVNAEANSMLYNARVSGPSAKRDLSSNFLETLYVPGVRDKNGKYSLVPFSFESIEQLLMRRGIDNKIIDYDVSYVPRPFLASTSTYSIGYDVKLAGKQVYHIQVIEDKACDESFFQG